jgi:hypothetical protein
MPIVNQRIMPIVREGSPTGGGTLRSRGSAFHALGIQGVEPAPEPSVRKPDQHRQSIVTALLGPPSSVRPARCGLWVHEIKHDGYRLMCGGDAHRVFTAAQN